jgi:hypothetical protein
LALRIARSGYPTVAEVGSYAPHLVAGIFAGGGGRHVAHGPGGLVSSTTAVGSSARLAFSPALAARQVTSGLVSAVVKRHNPK